jgi:hypothetical protein
MAINRTPPLDERIQNVRADVDAFIDAKVAETAKQCPGVPASVIRNGITARGGGCQCAVYLDLTKQDGAA